MAHCFQCPPLVDRRNRAHQKHRTVRIPPACRACCRRLAPPHPSVPSGSAQKQPRPQSPPIAGFRIEQAAQIRSRAPGLPSGPCILAWRCRVADQLCQRAYRAGTESGRTTPVGRGVQAAPPGGHFMDQARRVLLPDDLAWQGVRGQPKGGCSGNYPGGPHFSTHAKCHPPARTGPSARGNPRLRNCHRPSPQRSGQLHQQAAVYVGRPPCPSRTTFGRSTTVR